MQATGTLSGTDALGTARRSFLPMRFVVGGAVMVLAVAYLALVSLSSASVYYLTVSELQAKGASSQLVRVSGKVAPGTIVRDGAKLQFTVSDDAGRLAVIYSGVVPDIFTEQTDVVVEGRYDSDGVFRASTLLTKCPSRFEDSVGNTSSPSSASSTSSSG